MKKIKKALLLAMSLMMSASIAAACGGSSGGDDTSKDSTPPTSSVDAPESSEDPAPESSEDPAPESSEDPAPESSEDPAPESSEDPAPESSEDPAPESSEEPTVETYTLTLQNGSDATTAEYVAGATIEYPVLTANGMTFEGWYVVDEATGVESAAPATMPEGGLTVYAKWSYVVKTVTVNKLDGSVVTYKIAVEGNQENDLIAYTSMADLLAEQLSAPSETHCVVSYVGLPEVWELNDYAITEVEVDDDMSASIAWFDRYNKNIVEASGSVKVNKGNYWDGAANVVSVTNQKEVVYGDASSYATKVSFDLTKFTPEQLAEGTSADTSTWAGWDKKSMWVGYTIPVGGINLTNYELVFDAKFDNMNPNILAYAMSLYNGEQDASFQTGAHATFKNADAEDLGDGWYRYTLTLDCSNLSAVDYIVLSFDNTHKDYDATKEATVYIDNMSLNEVVNYTVTVDGVAEIVREGTEYTLTAPTKEGFEFLGWKDADGNDVGESFTVTGDIVLISQWEKLPLIAKVNESVEIDLTAAFEENMLWTECRFTAPAGTYYVKVTGGLQAFEIVSGEVSDIPVTQFVFTEETTVVFAVHAGADLEYTGSISVMKDNIAGLTATQLATVVLGDAYSATHENRAWVNGSTPEVLTEGIPEGFKKLNKFEWYKDSASLWKVGGNPFYRSCYNQTDISKFDVVKFMLKVETEGDAHFAFANKTKTASNVWLSFELVQTEKNVWTIIVTDEAGEVVFSAEGVVRNDSGLNAGVDSIASIVFPIASGTSQHTTTLLMPATTKDYDVNVYTTEILAYKEYTEIDPEIPEEATKVRYSVWRDDKYALSKTTDEKAPAGFESVVEYDWLGNTAKEGAAWGADQTNFPTFILDTTMNVAEYTDIYFAMKAENCMQIYVRGKAHYTAGGWLYVHYSQAENGTWSLSVKSADGTYAIENAQTGIVATTLQGLMAYANGGVAGCYPVRSSLDEAAIIYFTEVRAVAKPWEGPGISENAVVADGSAMYPYAGTQLVPNADLGEVTAPVGFTKVSRMDAVEGGVGSNNILSPGAFSTTNLLPYSEVWFALMAVNGRVTQTAPEWKDIDDNNTATWIYFHLTQTSVGVWSIEIIKDGALWGTITAQTGRDNNLGSILDYSTGDNGRIVLYQNSDLTKKLSVYATEIVGVERELDAFNPSIANNAEELSATAFISGYTTPSEMAAPAGFANVTEYSWNTGDFPVTGKMNNTNLAEYTDVYFAMKLVNGNGYYVQGCAMYYGESWLYVHLHKEADGTWTKTLQTEDGYYAQQKGLTDNTVAALMQWKSGANRGSYPKSHAKDLGITATAYFTEILVVEEPFDPGIAENAVKVRDSIWRNNGYALSATTEEPAPLGYTSVKEYNWTGNTALVEEKVDGVATGNMIPWGSNQAALPMTCLDEANFSEYNEVYFAMKLVNGFRFYVRGGVNYDATDWLYFSFVRAEDGTWSISLKSADGYEAINAFTGLTGNKLEDLINYKTLDGINRGCYPEKSADATDVRLYMTEVLAVRKPFDPAIPANVEEVRKSVWRDDGYALSATTSEPAPVGFSKIVEYDWNSHKADSTSQYTYCIDATTDLSGYTDIYFAVKLVNGSHIYVRNNTSGQHYTGSEWLYVHLQQTDMENHTWTISLRSADGYDVVMKDSYTGTVLKQFIENNIYGHRTDITWETKTYYTEVLGVKAPTGEER